MIVKGMLPMSLTENVGFMAYSMGLDKRYRVPGRKYLRTKLLPGW